ncbi:FkbM family methyltransferase [bacterium]|nr:FkbM family methyltransferase [bacterium]
MKRTTVYEHTEKYFYNGQEKYVSFFRPIELKYTQTIDSLFPKTNVQRPFHDKDGYYERAFVSKLAELLNHESVFFDIGANYGLETFVAARHCNPKNIHSFEVNPSTYDIVQKSNYHFASQKINVINAFIHCQDESGSLTIDKYVRGTKQAPTLIKMDIEGYELFAILGMEWVLDTYKPSLLIEFHPRLIRERLMYDDTAINEFYTFLLAKGYRILFNGHHYYYRSHFIREPDLEWRLEVPNNVNYALLAM